MLDLTKLGLVHLTLLQLIIEELAGLLVSTIHLKAVVEHGLVLGACSGEIHLLLLRHGSLRIFRRLLWSRVSASAKASSDGSDGAVGNG